MASVSSPSRRGILDWIEIVGNKLPEPVLLFALLAVLTVFVSGIGKGAGWQVQPLKVSVDSSVAADAAQAERPRLKVEPAGNPISVRNLMTGDGVYWMLSSMIRNFVNFPPLGLVMTGMLGIGLAEKVGLFGAMMKWLASITPRGLLSPMVVFIGANASIASDAGYIILPPLAAGLYLAMGRHPLAGLAAAFAGVAGGFGAGAFITGADAVLAGVATQASNILDPSVSVLATANWYFKAASVPVVSLAGWFVTDRIVEPRLKRAAVPIPEDAAFVRPGEMSLSSREKAGLVWAGLGMIAVLAVFISIMVIKGAPLWGRGQPTLPTGRLLLDAPATALEEGLTKAQVRPVDRAGPRWSQVIVPVMFFAFLVPGFIYGVVTRTIRSQQDLVGAMNHALKSIAPVLVMNFFAAQFLAYFAYTNLDQMLAYAGGAMLVRADLPVPVMLAVFVLFIIVADFAMSSMTAKFTLLAPILIPMFMMVGVSPGLMMGGYRIGDSVVNTITPLNSYLAIVLLVLQRYQKDTGLGSLIALMTPYSVVFGLVWTGFLLLWYALGWPLGPESPLHYAPAQ